MKKILDIPAVPNEAQNHFQLLDYFLHSATALRALVFDGVSKGSIGNLGKDFYIGYFLTAFYLFRYSIELAIKALIKEYDMDINYNPFTLGSKKSR